MYDLNTLQYLRRLNDTQKNVATKKLEQIS